MLDAFPWLTNGSLLFSQFVGGISMAMTLFLISIGLNVVFGVTRIVNFAHGSLFMVGAYMMAFLQRYFGAPSIFVFLLCILGAGILTGLIGMVTEYIFLRRIYRKNNINQFILTFGLTLVIENSIKFVFGSGYQKVSLPEVLQGSVPLGQATLPSYVIFNLIFTLVVVLSFFLVFRYSRLGLKSRAISTDREMTEALGTDVYQILTFVFGISALLAGLAGAAIAPVTSISTGMGANALLDSFLVVVIGGLGSILGSFFGALLVGQLQSFGVLVLPEMSSALIYVVMFVVLVFRPWGLLGSAEGRTEDIGVGQ